jgi:hypothetical protein
MIVVTTGSRTWTNESAVKEQLQDLQKFASKKGDGLSVVVGYNPKTQKPGGADKMVYKWCEVLGIHCVTEPADWNNGRIMRFGNRHVNMAGFDRNELMLDKYEPDLVLAFRASGKSNGTDHCMKEARKRHIPVRQIDE